MQWTDEAIVVSFRRHAERAAIVRVFTHAHGLYAGVIRGSSGNSSRGVWQAGNRVLVTWQARLAEHIGHLRGELIAPAAAFLLSDGNRLSALTAATALLELAVPERAPHPELFDAFAALVENLAHGEDESWTHDYVRFEAELLSSCGFRLDLSRCAATGQTGDLAYVSPVSGRAVSKAAGAPYHARLLALPRYFREGARDAVAVLEALKLTAYFLERWLLAPHDRTLPAARGRLIGALSGMPLEADSVALIS